MAARIGLSRADVVLSDGRTFEMVTVTSRRQRQDLSITNRRSGELLLELPDIAAVADVRRDREWLVTFKGSDLTATVKRSKQDCGCG